VTSDVTFGGQVVCQNCDQPLNEAQWTVDERLKSCPKCSADNGQQHVFLEYPTDFGKTKPRQSTPHPDGPQSWCEGCRRRGEVGGKLLCQTVKRGHLFKSPPTPPRVRRKAS
jgi:hypothetical protein